MDHRSRSCSCDACIALGRVASLVVDEETSDELRVYIAKALDKVYTKILEKGLELLRKAARGEAEAAGVGSHPTPGTGSAEPPAEQEVKAEEENPENEEEAPKKRKRRKRRAKEEEESAPEEKKESAAEEKERKGQTEETKTSPAQSETPGTSAAGVEPARETDPRVPLPRKVVKPSSNPAISLKEKKANEEGEESRAERLKLALRPKSRSRSRDKGGKDKKRRRSPSPASIPAAAVEEEVEEEGPPGDWEERPEIPRRPRSPDHPPPIRRRPTRGQLWLGPIRAHKNRPPPKKNKGIKKEIKNQRRPAAAVERRGILRRPAGAPAPGREEWIAAGEVSSDTLLGWNWMHIKGRYWEEEVELIGKAMDVKLKDTGREVMVKASGTPSESLLRVLTGIPSRQVRLHLCSDPCAALVWDEAYIHCSLLKEADRGSMGWSQNLEAAVEKDEGDELKILREGAEELRRRGKGVGGAPEEKKKRKKSPGSSGDEEKKKKEAGRIQGKKSLESLFSSTGLDPKAEVRRKVKRRARKVARRSRNKKRGSTSSGSGTSSSSSQESCEMDDKDLFEPATPTQRVWKQCPGALTMSMIAEAKEALLTQMGTVGEPLEGAVPAIANQYVRQVLMPTMSGPVARESHHWGLLLDLLLTGQVAAAADLGAQRLKALEGHSKGMKPELLRQLELVAQERPSLSSTTEIMKAGRQANEEQKVLQKASFRESQEKGKGQCTDWRDRQAKGDKGGKQEKGKKGKAEGKKKAA
ncbi:Uncharacterized protein SCF082_LOCUS930 [Durusdinium trenchii]|uniref:Uncharacterized protein n=1 Tax=Durusdinium trenchii TaxID=1381693 RepID=A0ABP0HAV1_9DINO